MLVSDIDVAFRKA